MKDILITFLFLTAICIYFKMNADGGTQPESDPVAPCFCWTYYHKSAKHKDRVEQTTCALEEAQALIASGRYEMFKTVMPCDSSIFAK